MDVKWSGRDVFWCYCLNSLRIPHRPVVTFQYMHRFGSSRKEVSFVYSSPFLFLSFHIFSVISFTFLIFVLPVIIFSPNLPSLSSALTQFMQVSPKTRHCDRTMENISRASATLSKYFPRRLRALWAWMYTRQIGCYIPAFAWRDWGRTSASIVDSPAEIRTYRSWIQVRSVTAWAGMVSAIIMNTLTQ